MRYPCKFIFASLTLCFLARTTFAMDAEQKTLPHTLKEAMTDAIRLNPKTVSTDELMESVHYATLAAKAAMLPTASFTCTTGNAHASYTSAGAPGSLHDTTVTRSCGPTLSWEFDAGTKFYTYKSAKANEDATRAAYNTADSLLTNTRGALASQTLLDYMSYVQNKDRVAFFNYIAQALNDLKKLGPSSNLNAEIATVTETQQSILDGMPLLIQEFHHIVTMDPAQDIENMDSAITAMKIPADVNDAISIALSEGPEVQRRNSNVQMAEYGLKAARAALGPSGGVSIGYGRSKEIDTLSGENESYRGPTVSASISIPLTFGAFYDAKSAEKNLASARSQREAAIDDAKNSISVSYISLQNQRRSYVSMDKNFNDQMASLKDAIAKIDAGQTAGYTTSDLLVTVGNLENQYFEVQNAQMQILNLLFGIQQVTGLLFVP